LGRHAAERAAKAAVTPYFAYGSNMSRASMRKRCPNATAIGPAALAGYRFAIVAEGYASVMPRAGATVHGVLWRLTPRDLAALNAYESLASGLYCRATLPVGVAGRQILAMVYVARSRGEGRPRPDYLELIVRAAREWKLPPDYVRQLERRLPTRWRGSALRETGELG
jgi:cation transport regulator ChaC